MKLVKNVKVAVAVVGLTGAIAGGTALAAASSAQAATANTLTICARGNYSTFAQVPQQGYAETYVAYPGQCRSIWVASSTSYAKVYGRWNTHPQDHFYVGTAHFSGSAGGTFYAVGTSTNPGLTGEGE